MQTLSRNDLTPAPPPYAHYSSALAFQARHEDRASDVIYIVEADRDARERIAAFLVSAEMNVVSFESAAEYLAFTGRDTAACAVLNINLDDIAGLELQRQLAQRGGPPVIFISDRCDVASTVRAMKAGAIEFFTKPVDPSALIAAVRIAFAQDRKMRQKRAELAELQRRFSSLTPRECEVLPLVVGGLLNKQAASLLGISEVTLQIHRSQVMRKMQAESLAELVRMSVKLHIPYWREVRPRIEEQQESTFFLVRGGSGTSGHRGATMRNRS